MDLHYLLYDLADYYLPRLTSRAPPPSQMAILAERCCIHRESAASSSRRLPASFGGPLGFLLAAFEILRLLLGRPEESAESRMGSLFRIPYFLSDFVNVPKRIGILHVQIKTTKWDGVFCKSGC